MAVLTRDRQYVKKPESFRHVYQRVFRKYPHMIQALDNRHKVYGKSRELLFQLEKEGKALVIAPETPILLSRFEKDRDKAQRPLRPGPAGVPPLGGRREAPSFCGEATGGLTLELLKKWLRKPEREIAIHETLLVGICLAAAGGFLDAYTYTLRGGVFANAQTGNLVLLALRAAQGDWQGAFYYVIPVLAFFCGILLTETIKLRTSDRHFLLWQHFSLLVEMALLAVVGFFAPVCPGRGGECYHLLCVFRPGAELSQDPGPALCHHHVYRQPALRRRLLFGIPLSEGPPGPAQLPAVFADYFLFLRRGGGGSRLLPVAGRQGCVLCCGALGLVFLVMALGKKALPGGECFWQKGLDILRVF